MAISTPAWQSYNVYIYTLAVAVEVQCPYLHHGSYIRCLYICTLAVIRVQSLSRQLMEPQTNLNRIMAGYNVSHHRIAQQQYITLKIIALLSLSFPTNDNTMRSFPFSDCYTFTGVVIIQHYILKSVIFEKEHQLVSHSFCNTLEGSGFRAQGFPCGELY